MEKFKKIISGLCALLAIPTLGVSATGNTYLRGDVDGNGTVNMVDLTCVNQYLNGRAASDGETAERLDLNRDYVIDINDRVMLMQILTNVLPVIQVNSVNTTMTATQSAIQYQKYDAQTGVAVGAPYTLYNVGNITSSSQSRGIVGNDDREIDYSKSGVVKLSMGGTGFVVGSHTIMTARHCVINQGTETPVTNMEYTLYSSSGVPSEEKEVKYYHAPTVKLDDDSSDYALLIVEEDLSDYMCFDLGVFRDGIINIINDDESDRKLEITGWAGQDDFGANDDLLNEIVTGSGYFTNGDGGNIITSKRLYYTVDMVHGTSGAPIYIEQEDGQATVIGINTGGLDGNGYNCGRRIDTSVLHFVYNNPNL